LRPVIILHEWDGRPYFEALDRFVREETGKPPLYRELWFIRQLALGLLRRNPVLARRGLANACFFLRSFFLRESIIVLGFAPFDASMLFWSRLRRRHKVIYHTSWIDWGGDVPHQGGIFRGLIRRRWKRFLEDPRVRVVSVLPESKPALLARYAMERGRLQAIPHAIDLSVFHTDEARPASQADPLRVVYVGRLNSRKGIDVLAELIAAADPAKVRFGIVGDGPEAFRLEPLRGRFEDHGFVRGKEGVARILRGYDVLVLPSLFEPFGLVFLEAMACGVVCIASEGLFPKDLIFDGENGFIRPRRAEAFAAALETLRGDRALLARMRARGFETARRYSLEAVALRWRDVLLG
jgi:glycosyltransferase involved in cell wall biosynthesis